MLQEPRFQCLGFLVLYYNHDIFLSFQYCFLVCSCWFEKGQFLKPESNAKLQVRLKIKVTRHGIIAPTPPSKFSSSLHKSEVQMQNVPKNPSNFIVSHSSLYQFKVFSQHPLMIPVSPLNAEKIIHRSECMTF